MIKNAPRLLLAALAPLALSVLGASCRPGPPAPEGHQGIVELDERVLSFEVGGRIVAVPLRRGDMVKDGALIAKVDDTLERLARQARADEEAAARADLALLEAGARREDVGSLASEAKGAATAEDLAKKNAERVRALVDANAIPRAELDRVEAELDRAASHRRSMDLRLSALQKGARPEEIARAKARALAARSVLELADARLARYELRSKTDGIVLDVHVDPGELANVGTPGATVADVTHPYVDVFVPQGALGGLVVGARAEVRVDSRAAPLAGVIEYVSPKTEFTPRFLFSDRERPHLVIRVRVRVQDPERELHAGVPAFVRFTP